MARRVLADFDTELFERLARRSNISATQRAMFLDDAYRWVCMTYLHPQIEATTTGTCALAGEVVVPVATDIWWVEAVKDTTNGKLLEPSDKDRIEDMLKQTGVPTEWYWWNSEVVVDRKPAAARPYKLWYIKSVAELTVGTSPIIDRIFDPVITMKAAEIGLSIVRDFKEVSVLIGEIDRYCSQFKLPKRENRKKMLATGIQMRMK